MKLLEQIAEIVGADIGAVKSRLRRVGAIAGSRFEQEKFMNEHDPLNDLLREWKSPEPADELERRITSAYRATVWPSIWRRFWKTRISIPAPALVSAALAVLALFLWLRPHSRVPVTPAPGPTAVQPETRVTLADFQPVEQLEPHIVKQGQ